MNNTENTGQQQPNINNESEQAEQAEHPAPHVEVDLNNVHVQMRMRQQRFRNINPNDICCGQICGCKTRALPPTTRTFCQNNDCGCSLWRTLWRSLRRNLINGNSPSVRRTRRRDGRGSRRRGFVRGNVSRSRLNVILVQAILLYFS